MRVLVANRGEIAVRILRALRRLGHETLAVYSEADREARFLGFADRSKCIGPASALESYLSIDRLIEAGRELGAEAIHPGYGFLSENAEFARRVEAEGWTFIGPRPDSIEAMGDKTRALEIARSAQVPTVPSLRPDPDIDPKSIQAEVEKIGFPVMIKAAAGGGGKGMRIARTATEFVELYPAAIREAKAAFGDGRVFVEKYLTRARHVEVQVLGDGEGAGIALGERDCSVQRRHQKLIEECPAPGLEPKTRERLAQASVNLVESTCYRGAGTVEFMVTESEEFFFLEMNTRLQVEHPVTELVFGVDLVRAQLEIATEGKISERIRAAKPVGHSIELRVYAEDPQNNFLPSIGRIEALNWPQGDGVRVDTGFDEGDEITLHYDPMIAKVIAYGDDRPDAIRKLAQALRETFIAGFQTTVDFGLACLEEPVFARGDMTTSFIPDHMTPWETAAPDSEWLAAAALFLKQQKSTTPGTGARSLPPAWEALTGWRIA